MRHVKATVDSALERSPDAVPSGRTLAPNVEDCLEWPALRFVLLVLHVVLATVDLILALENLVQPELLQHPSGHEEACAVGRRVVLEANGDAKGSQVRRGGGRDHLVSYEGCVGHLADA